MLALSLCSRHTVTLTYANDSTNTNVHALKNETNRKRDHRRERNMISFFVLRKCASECAYVPVGCCVHHSFSVTTIKADFEALLFSCMKCTNVYKCVQMCTKQIHTISSNDWDAQAKCKLASTNYENDPSIWCNALNFNFTLFLLFQIKETVEGLHLEEKNHYFVNIILFLH